jgi:hypothetical protein
MISDVEHFFIYLLDFLYIFWKISVQILYPFLKLGFLTIELLVSYVFWILTPCYMYDLQIHSPIP